MDTADSLPPRAIAPDAPPWSPAQRVLAAGGLPLPGGGATAERLRALAAAGAEDLSVARLAEGHADAVAILAEAGREAQPQTVYGVWAAVSGKTDVTATRDGETWRLSGVKQFCSGASLCDRALVRARADDDDLLFDVDLRQAGVAALDGTWPAVGMEGSDSRAVSFESVRMAADGVLGGPGFYVERPGFWHGGVGVAAVWFGGARGVLDAAAASLAPTAGDGELALLGSAVAHVEAMDALLERAGREIDEDPQDRRGGARRRALVTRHALHAGAGAVLAAAAGAGGARPVSLEPDNARRVADLYVYLAQHHPGRDGAALGRLSAARSPG
ncbi:acyl-CoA/acyl-ACP dehydrogenase [Acidiferrimicrobium sp. IK]|uniref:acyl-CoA dehydrogenase family protein n=1 Tax=Acidiferrimicrobium sp. IK TaxID=2871700 RepID=UPI0021CB1B11|nr:acyl-CoA dehydrogenase family protein [Acidiferrimicrobium sp. IK]MCU4185462.1 acyl-CoA/acyl-ACP dehydrogenase [Acidiferrimicrobium sp. IK]